VWSVLINPGIPIPPELSAIHHIIDEDVAGQPSWDFVLPDFIDDEEDEIVAYAAHNAKFEQQWFTPAILKKPIICTYRSALRVWTNAPSYSNQVLRYWLKLDCDRKIARDVHRAGPDAYVTAHLLRELLKHATAEQLIEWSGQPALLPRVNFGKHKGKAWKDVPPYYINWMIRQPDMNEDVLFSARHHLGGAS
jgi:exodeoxyribonuclease X